MYARSLVIPRRGAGGIIPDGTARRARIEFGASYPLNRTPLKKPISMDGKPLPVQKPWMSLRGFFMDDASGT